jgi:alanine dehydrogenase
MTLTLGVLGSSAKENERRLPIHPVHVERIDADLREHIYLEQGYGERYGVSDEHLTPLVAGMLSQDQLFETSDIMLMPKPTHSDVRAMRDGQVLWGWPHCVQDAELTQMAIDKQLTLIAWEAMNHWKSDGSFVVHVFHQNNELAGYCSVLHALVLAGSTGHYGNHMKAAVIGFGNTARGAITALTSLGIHDVTALTMRDITAVASPIPAVVLEHLDRVDPESMRTHVITEDATVATAEFLADHDLIVNCVLQDTDRPLMFVNDEELDLLAPGTVIVDVSCDLGMGFSFAKPTTFEEPTFMVGDGITYYAVDHSPAYLWNSATWTISDALIPYLRTVMSGEAEWHNDVTIERAIEIQNGVVRNPRILSFQNRAADHPHRRLRAE